MMRMAGGRITRVQVVRPGRARAWAASQYPRGIASIPARTISQKYALDWRDIAMRPLWNAVVPTPVSWGSAKWIQKSCTRSGVLRKSST